MSENIAYTVKNGFTPSQQIDAVQLFWEAFKGKLGLVMKPETKALGFLELVADPNHAISANAPNGTLLGIAGFKSEKGSFIGGNLKEMCAIYGWFGGLWRGLILSVLERPLETGVLLMDGIFVEPSARGMGIGSALLTAIKDRAVTLHCSKVRLDVIDINPRARALYERQGFVEETTTDIGLLRYVFGFKKSTTMIYNT